MTVNRDRECNFNTGKFTLVNRGFNLVNGANSVKQACDIALNTWLGTYFLDSTVGMPFLQKVFVKNYNRNDIIYSIRSILVAIPGIVSVDNVTISVTARVATITWAAKATDNIPLSGTISTGV